MTSCRLGTVIQFTEFFKAINLFKIRNSTLLAVEVDSGPLTAIRLPRVKSAFTSAVLDSKEQHVTLVVRLAMNSELAPVLARVYLEDASYKLVKLRVAFCCL